ncbi:MAG: hypothetical protein EXS00_03255 [Phycisphaerales bacterium]|nr:hypothetical protein [Phycisphaerales bacterium]
MKLSHIASVALVLSFASQSTRAEESISIERLAPANSFAVIAFKDLAAIPARFKATPLGQLLESDAGKKALESYNEASKEAKEARAKELSLEPSDLNVLPKACGAAMFFEHSQELDADLPAVIAVMDFGDQADTAQKFIDALCDEIARDTGSSIEEETIGTRTAKVIPVPSGEGDGDDSFSPLPGGPPRQRPQMEPDFGSMIPSFDSVCYTREGTTFIFTSSLGALQDALDVIDGKAAESVADEKQFQAAIDQIGPQDAYAVLLFNNLEPLLAPMFSGPMAMAKDIFKTFIGHADGFSLGLKLDGAVGMIEVVSGISMSSPPTGLIALASKASPLSVPPVLGGDDCSSYYQMNFNFAGVPQLFEDALAALPDGDAAQLEPMLAMYMPALKKAFSSLGPTIWSFSQVSAQLPEGSRSVTAIQCSEEKSVVPLINMIAPQAGMMPQDFQGQTIYRGDAEQMSMALGFAGTALVFGESASVEQAMRTAAEKSARPLSDSENYRLAIAATPSGELIGWGYLDLLSTVEQLKNQYLEASNANADADGFLDPSGNPIGALLPAIPDGIQSAITELSSTILRDHLGLMVYEIRPAPGGMVYRMSVLAPSARK